MKCCDIEIQWNFPVLLAFTVNDAWLNKVSRQIYWQKYFYCDVNVSNLDEFCDASIDPKTPNSYSTVEVGKKNWRTVYRNVHIMRLLLGCFFSIFPLISSMNKYKPRSIKKHVLKIFTVRWWCAIFLQIYIFRIKFRDSLLCWGFIEMSGVAFDIYVDLTCRCLLFDGWK